MHMLGKLWSQNIERNIWVHGGYSSIFERNVFRLFWKRISSSGEMQNQPTYQKPASSAELLPVATWHYFFQFPLSKTLAVVLRKWSQFYLSTNTILGQIKHQLSSWTGGGIMQTNSLIKRVECHVKNLLVLFLGCQMEDVEWMKRLSLNC